MTANQIGVREESQGECFLLTRHYYYQVSPAYQGDTERGVAPWELWEIEFCMHWRYKCEKVKIRLFTHTNQIQ